jgi:tetratricopeptide (TPR) repeat protein
MAKGTLDAAPRRRSAVERARDLHQAGVAAGDDGQLVAADRLFHRALSALQLDADGALTTPRTPTTTPAASRQRRARDEVAARILLSMALPAYERGDLEAGLNTLADAARVADRAQISAVGVLIDCQRGVLMLRAGRPGEAVLHLDRAVRKLRFAAPVEQCKIMMNRGDAHHLVGDISRARADFAAAVEIAGAHGLSEFVFRNTHNVAFMEYLAGNLPRALELMPTGESATSDYARGVIGMDRAKVLLSAGLFSEADAALQQACTALERTDLVQLLAEAELARAETALRSGDAPLAQRLSRRAAARFTRRRNHRSTALARLVQLQADLAAGRRLARLTTEAELLAVQLSAHRLPDQARTARLLAVEAALDSGRSSVADQIPVRVGERIDLRLHVRLVRARLAFARDDATVARREIRRGLAELSDYQAGFGSFDLQTSSAAHGVDLAALAVTADLAAHRPAAVLIWLERARAISGRIPAVQPPVDPVTADLLAQLRWAVSQINDEETAGADAEPMRRRRIQLEREIRTRSWTVPGSAVARKVPTPSEIQAELGDGTLVALFGLHGQIHAIVLHGSRCSTRQLTSLSEISEIARRLTADLDVLALDRIPEPLRASARGSLFAGLEALDRLLLAPLRLPDAPVVLLPPGPLASLAWGHLPTFRGRPLTVAPSASAWLAARSRLTATPGRVVAVAGPGLARAEEEVADIAAAWSGCETLTGANATGAAVLAAIDGAKLVHVAAHGTHQRDSPLFSAIGLADGPVVGYDLDQVPQPPEQAVLSACELGQATVRAGNEALGLTRALLHSGTATVIAGVAKVSDRGAATLMADYHRRLCAGGSAAVALADSLVAAEEPIPFVCFGAGW